MLFCFFLSRLNILKASRRVNKVEPPRLQQRGRRRGRDQHYFPRKSLKETRHFRRGPANQSAASPELASHWLSPHALLFGTKEENRRNCVFFLSFTTNNSGFECLILSGVCLRRMLGRRKRGEICFVMHRVSMLAK